MVTLQRMCAFNFSSSYDEENERSGYFSRRIESEKNYAIKHLRMFCFSSIFWYLVHHIYAIKNQFQVYKPQQFWIFVSLLAVSQKRGIKCKHFIYKNSAMRKWT